MQKLVNPFPLFLDEQGTLLDAGFVYVGEVGTDPELSPVSVYWDPALTIKAAQPLRTRGGMIVNGASPANVFIVETNYSLRTRDADGLQVTYTANAVATVGGTTGADVETPDFQPLDSDLTAIAALTTTTFGRNLLTLANATALKTAAGIVDALPTVGGTVSGNIVRNGAGTHLYHTDAAMTSGRVFTTNSAASDPTSLPGDIWIKTT